MKTLTAIFVLAAALLLSACERPPSSSDIQRDRQEKVVAEGAAQVGIPSIVNFREMKVLKDVYERRDKALVTYTYFENMNPQVVKGHTALGGKLTYLGETISYPIPYATQYTSPQAVQRYVLPKLENEGRIAGTTTLPQADPNGLYSPGSADATWVMMKNPNGTQVEPVYVEPKLVTFPFKLPMD